MPPRDATDPVRAGSSLRNLARIVLPALDAAGASHVVEIGSSHGDFTAELLAWAAGSGARITAIEPVPPPELLALGERHGELELVRSPSADAIPALARPDAVIVDGDHNYHTVSEELRLISEASPGAGLPLVLLHDVGWPHGRRDRYYEPERIPPEARMPIADTAHLDPADAGTVAGGFYFESVAEREGGARNGVLTAVEDFVAGDEELRLAIVPGFFGLGVLWHRDAPWSEAIAELVAPWDRSPLLEALEADRVFQLVRWAATEQRREHLERVREMLEAVLRNMLDSRAFAAGERLSRLRRSGEPRFSREQVRRALGDED